MSVAAVGQRSMIVIIHYFSSSVDGDQLHRVREHFDQDSDEALIVDVSFRASSVHFSDSIVTTRVESRETCRFGGRQRQVQKRVDSGCRLDDITGSRQRFYI